MPKIGDTRPGAVDCTKLLETYPPKHPAVHRPKRRVRTNTTTNVVLDRAPSQGIINWRKQDGIKVGQPDNTIWAAPPARGMAVMKSAKERPKQGKKG